MPETLSPPYDASEEVTIPRKKWTRQEYRALAAEGILAGSRFELIEGDIVFKMGQNPPHVLVVALMLRVLVGIFGFEFVQSQAPVALSDDGEPEPDLAVTVHPLREYLTRGTPTAADVRLVVEVSDATLTADRTVKAHLYGRAGIPEYWIVDIANRCLLVFRQPQAEGYAQIIAYNESETLSLLAAPEASVCVADLLP